MAGSNVRALMHQILGTPGDYLPEHIQTVKISATAHARLRALSDLVGRSKTPLAADLLTAAIDDAIDMLPSEPLDEATADKLRGVGKKFGISRSGTVEYEGTTIAYELPPEPNTLRDIALERAHIYLSHDEYERWEKEAATTSEPGPISQNGAHK